MLYWVSVRGPIDRVEDLRLVAACLLADGFTHAGIRLDEISDDCRAADCFAVLTNDDGTLDATTAAEVQLYRSGRNVDRLDENFYLGNLRLWEHVWCLMVAKNKDSTLSLGNLPDGPEAFLKSREDRIRMGRLDPKWGAP